MNWGLHLMEEKAKTIKTIFFIYMLVALFRCTVMRDFTARNTRIFTIIIKQTKL